MDATRLILVDGYNLILRSSQLKPGPDRTLREAREKLVSLLSWAVGAGEARFLVVFDGREQGGDDEGAGRVEVRFSRPPEKADDLIRRLVEERVERVDHLTVVTSDLEVARDTRAMGAEIALADLFLSSVLGPAGGAADAPEKPASISKKELEEWATLFRSRKPNDGSETER
ncbi:MAG: NYN domain-containing protein [Candidatus Eiseniibacteriota bacterium]